MPWDHKQSVKEVLRHILFKTRCTRALMALRQWRGFTTVHLSAADIAARFDQIYRLNAWVHSKDQVSTSGTGSEDNATSHLFSALPPLLKKLDCHKLLDVGCGDWNWMRNVTLACEYLGLDIVEDVIKRNQVAYEGPGIAFQLANVISDPLPKADVALCRDVLFHLSFSDGSAVIENIRKSARWLVATTDRSIWFNSDIVTGDFRKINLEQRPYRLPRPCHFITDDSQSPGRILGAWCAEQLPKQISLCLSSG